MDEKPLPSNVENNGKANTGRSIQFFVVLCEIRTWTYFASTELLRDKVDDF